MAQTPQDLLDRIRRLETEVAELRGRANIRPAMNQVLNGDVHIGPGGRLILDDTDGSGLLYAGKIVPDYADGSTQRGVILWRATGEIALALYTDAGDVTKSQRIVMWDKAGQRVMSTAADGLGRPYLSIPMWPTDIAHWPSTSSTGWADLWTGTVPRQHAAVAVQALGVCSAATSGELRLTVNGTPLGDPVAMSSASFLWAAWSGAVGGTHMSDLTLVVQGRVTSGSGSVSCRLDYAHGREA